MGRSRQEKRQNHAKKIEDRPTRGDPKDRQRKTARIDRRSLNDRRRAHDLDYFTDGGVERRKWWERRHRLVEPRKGWDRVSDWTSAVIGYRRRPTVSDRVYKIDEEE